MRATIHQPYFIPWLGYFSKLTFSDIFVILDNVNFRKRHFLDRTRIVNMQGEIYWLSLPVGENFGKKCNEVVLNHQGHLHREKLIKTIEQSYAKARFFEKEWPQLHDILMMAIGTNSGLVEINTAILKNILKILEVPTPTIKFASDLTLDGEDATDRIITISKRLGITSIIIGSGMSIEVHNWRKITNCGIRVYMHNYSENHPVYEQSRRKRIGFQIGLSIIDAILNVGRDRTKFFLTDICRPVHLKIC